VFGAKSPVSSRSERADKAGAGIEPANLYPEKGPRNAELYKSYQIFEPSPLAMIDEKAN
jgi:hypothetical protein